MPYLPLRKNRRAEFAAAALAAALAVGGGAWLVLMPASAQDDAKDKPPRPKKAKPADKPAVAAPAAAVPTPPASATPAPPAQAAAAPDFAARLRENGAGTCAAQVDALAAGSMGNVKSFNTASGWATAGGDRRVVTLSIGQRYADGSPVPYGATSVVAAPDGRGSCDALAVQVVPSPLPCAKLRETMSAGGKQIGDLAGVPLMQDAGGQTMLVPTAANTCVLVGLRAAYAK